MHYRSHHRRRASGSAAHLLHFLHHLLHLFFAGHDVVDLLTNGAAELVDAHQTAHEQGDVHPLLAAHLAKRLADDRGDVLGQGAALLGSARGLVLVDLGAEALEGRLGLVGRLRC